MICGRMYDPSTISTSTSKTEQNGDAVVHVKRFVIVSPRAADIGESEESEIIEFEPFPEVAPVETPAPQTAPAEPVPA